MCKRKAAQTHKKPDNCTIAYCQRERPNESSEADNRIRPFAVPNQCHRRKFRVCAVCSFGCQCVCEVHYICWMWPHDSVRARCFVPHEVGYLTTRMLMQMNLKHNTHISKQMYVVRCCVLFWLFLFANHLKCQKNRNGAALMTPAAAVGASQTLSPSQPVSDYWPTVQSSSRAETAAAENMKSKSAMRTRRKTTKLYERNLIIHSAIKETGGEKCFSSCWDAVRKMHLPCFFMFLFLGTFATHIISGWISGWQIVQAAQQ